MKKQKISDKFKVSIDKRGGVGATLYSNKFLTKIKSIKE